MLHADLLHRLVDAILDKLLEDGCRQRRLIDAVDHPIHDLALGLECLQGGFVDALFQFGIKQFRMLLTNGVDDLNADQCMDVFFVARILDLLIGVLHHVLEASKVIDHIELREERDVLDEEGKEDDCIQILLLGVLVEAMRILAQILDATLNPFQLEVLLKDVLQFQHGEQTLVGVVVNHLGVGHDIAEILQSGMRKVLSKFSPESFYSHLDLTNG